MFIRLKGQTVAAHQLNRIVSNEDAVKVVLRGEIIRVDCPALGKQVHAEIDQALSKKTTQMIDIDALVAKATPEPEAEEVDEAPADEDTDESE